MKYHCPVSGRMSPVLTGLPIRLGGTQQENGRGCAAHCLKIQARLKGCDVPGRRVVVLGTLQKKIRTVAATTIERRVGDIDPTPVAHCMHTNDGTTGAAKRGGL
ncbi:hypothetical protein CBL_00083 [Carabus blaptoides fortunei]